MSSVSGAGGAGGRVLKAPHVRLLPAGLEAEAAEAARRREAAEAGARRRAEVEAAYRAGLEDGRADALGDLPRLAATVQAALDAALDDLADRRQEAAASVVDAALELAAWVVGREVVADTSLLTYRLDLAAGHLPAGPLVVRVAPAAVEAVAAWAGGRPVEVVADPSLGTADAVVTAGAAEADLRVGPVLDRAREALDG